MAFEAPLQDVNGTLAEPKDLHRRAFNATFADHHLDWCWSRDEGLTRLITA